MPSGLLRLGVASLAWLTAVTAVTAAAQETGGSEEAPALAQQRYEAGVECYDAGDHECALSEMRASYEIFASPNSLLWAGRALRELGRLAEAVAELDHAAAEARDGLGRDRRYRETERAAAEERDALLPRVGRLDLRVTGPAQGARVWIGDREIPAAALGAPIFVDPGEAELRIEAEGFDPIRRAISIDAGRELRLAMALRASGEALEGAEGAPAPVGGVFELFFAGIGLDLAGFGGLGASLALYLQADDIYRELRVRCGATPCPSDLGPRIEAGRQAELGSAIALGVGAALVATGLVLIGIAFTRGDEASRARLRLGPTYASVEYSF